MNRKSIVFLLTLFFSALAVSAQSFRVFMKSGVVEQFECAEVDSLVFDEPQVASPTFGLSCTDITMTSALLSVIPDDDNVRYYFDCVTMDQYESSNENIASIVEGYITHLQQNYPMLSLADILDALLSTGPASDEVKGLPAATDFVFYAIAVNDEGKCYGEASTIAFRTLQGGNPEDCTFEISYANLSSSALTVLVTPSDDSVPYWMSIAACDDYPGDKAMAMNVKEAIEEYATSKGMTIKQVVKGVTFTGACSSEESGLQPNTSYYIYVYAMDENGDSAGKMYKKKFTTLLTDYSDADVSLKYRYFNGDDLYALDAEKYAKTKGRVYIQAIITPNEVAANWALALAQNDLTDEQAYPEEATKNAVLQGGFLNVTEKFFVADWTTCTFLYFAADAAGIDGPLKRLLVTFDPVNARPVNELETMDAPASIKRIPQVLSRRSSSVISRRFTTLKQRRRTFRPSIF